MLCCRQAACACILQAQKKPVSRNMRMRQNKKGRADDSVPLILCRINHGVRHRLSILTSFVSFSAERQGLWLMQRFFMANVPSANTLPPCCLLNPTEVTLLRGLTRGTVKLPQNSAGVPPSSRSASGAAKLVLP